MLSKRLRAAPRLPEPARRQAAVALSGTLQEYLPKGATEAAALLRARALDLDELLSRHAPLHLTCSAVVVDQASGKVLLRYHDRLQRWLQVGGHIEADDLSPMDAALREAQEESGLQDLQALEDTPVVHLAIVPVPASGVEPAHEHLDLRYLLVTRSAERARPEHPGAPLRWLDVREAVDVVADDNLATCLERVAKRLSPSSLSTHDRTGR